MSEADGTALRPFGMAVLKPSDDTRDIGTDRFVERINSDEYERAIAPLKKINAHVDAAQPAGVECREAKDLEAESYRAWCAEQFNAWGDKYTTARGEREKFDAMIRMLDFCLGPMRDHGANAESLLVAYAFISVLQDTDMTRMIHLMQRLDKVKNKTPALHQSGKSAGKIKTLETNGQTSRLEGAILGAYDYLTKHDDESEKGKHLADKWNNHCEAKWSMEKAQSHLGIVCTKNPKAIEDTVTRARQAIEKVRSTKAKPTQGLKDRDGQMVDAAYREVRARLAHDPGAPGEAVRRALHEMFPALTAKPAPRS